MPPRTASETHPSDLSAPFPPGWGEPGPPGRSESHEVVFTGPISAQGHCEANYGTWPIRVLHRCRAFGARILAAVAFPASVAPLAISICAGCNRVPQSQQTPSALPPGLLPVLIARCLFLGLTSPPSVCAAPRLRFRATRTWNRGQTRSGSGSIAVHRSSLSDFARNSPVNPRIR